MSHGRSIESMVQPVRQMTNKVHKSILELLYCVFVVFDGRAALFTSALIGITAIGEFAKVLKKSL